MLKQSVTVLGSTGSIGTNTLDVIARHPDRFSVFALCAATQVETMLAQIQAHQPQFAVMASEPHARVLADRVRAAGLSTQVLSGVQAACDVASDERVDSVMAAIVGAAGLSPCMAAAKAGKKIMLANKEALVVGGHCFMQAVKDGGAVLLPIDSEHSAVFQSLPEDRASWSKRVQKIILTASGGPFRNRAVETLSQVTVAESTEIFCPMTQFGCAHASATMMNKALEVIEARYLFGVEPGQIEVVIHPQSVIHSMVQYHDASIVAQLGTPDMRVPIAYGLSWPERIVSGANPVNFLTVAPLTFETPDPRRFPGLSLAWQALEAAPGTTAVLNAANEVAVAAFLGQRIRFDQIHAVNLATLSQVLPGRSVCIEDLLVIDAESRSVAELTVQSLSF